MKVFFPLLTGEWARKTGFGKRWEKYVRELRTDSSPHTITDNQSIADLTIGAGCEALSVGSIFRPLTNKDIRSIVWDWNDRVSGRASGFYCSLEPSLYSEDRHRIMHYPVDWNMLVAEFPQEDTIYDFGFLGGITAGVRRRLIQTLKPTEKRDNSMITVQSGNFPAIFERTADGEDPAKRDFARFLRKTRFVLCPRGYGISSVRLFETLKAGRVPVIVSDRYLLPKGIDWESCSLRVRENQIESIPKLVKSRMEQWPSLARNARVVWQEYFSPENTFRYLMHNVEEMLGTRPNATLGRQIKYSLNLGKEVAADRLRPMLGAIKALIKGEK